jgi:hypothetical protein
MEADDLTALTWDEGGPWQFALEMRRRAPGGWAVSAVLRRGEERLDLSSAVLVTQGALVFTRDRVAPLAEDTPVEWLSRLREAGPIEAPEKDKDELLAALLCLPGLPPLEVPEDLRYEEVTLLPRPCLRVRAGDPARRDGGRLRAELSFDYEGRLVPADEPTRGFYQADRRRLSAS